MASPVAASGSSSPPPSEPPDPDLEVLSHGVWSSAAASRPSQAPYRHLLCPTAAASHLSQTLLCRPCSLYLLRRSELLSLVVPFPPLKPELPAPASPPTDLPMQGLLLPSPPYKTPYPPSLTFRSDMCFNPLLCDTHLVCVVLELMGLKTFDSAVYISLRFEIMFVGLKIFLDFSTLNYFIAEIIILSSDFKSTACMRLFTALCRFTLILQLMSYLLYTASLSSPIVVVGASVSAAQPISPAFSITRKLVSLSSLTVKSLVSSRGQKIPHGFELLEMDSVRCFFRSGWCLLVACSPTPPEPPDPPDYIIFSHCLFVTWIYGFTVLTLSSLGDMSIVTARSSTASIPPSNQGSFLLVIWNAWSLDGSPLPLYEDRFTLPLYEDQFTLPLYEDHFTLPLYEDRSTLPLYEEFVTLPLYEDFVTLPLYEDLGSFMEFVTPLCSLFLNGCVTRGVIKGSFGRRLYVSVAILEIGNCALVAVPISGVRSSTQGVILLNNSIVEEIRGLLEDFYLFKCYVAIIFLRLSASFVVVSFYAMMAMLFGNIYSVFGD